MADPICTRFEKKAHDFTKLRNTQSILRRLHAHLLPKEAALDGSWKAPPITKTP